MSLPDIASFYGRLLCNRQQPSYFASRFFQTLFLRRLCTDFLETLPHAVGSSAIETSPTFVYMHRKEIRGQKPHFGDFFERRIKILQ